MAEFHHDFHRVSRAHPCPICGKPDWCAVSRDGLRVLCNRISEGSRTRTAAGWLHDLEQPFRNLTPPSRPSASKTPPRSRTDWSGLQAWLTRGTEQPVAELAELLGISQDSLLQLGCGYSSEENYWTFPERDGNGTLIGILRRYPDGTKKRFPGSRNGLTYSPGWNTGSGPVLLVEGASDTAALMTLGLSAVGRPSNLGGVPLLAELLQQIPEDREIIVVGERDQKPGGLWPGREGAIQTARELAKRLERPLFWALPPDNAKDVREWLNQYGGREPQRLQDLFLAGLHRQRMDPPPTYRATPCRKPELSLEEYRRLMQRARLRSLDRPGIYLDRSGTGTGKSTVDLEVIRSMHSPSQEVA